MPHAIIEHSPNLEHPIVSKHVLHVVHGIMETSGLFAPLAIKTRRYVCDDYLIGTTGREGSFIHVSILLLSGRSTKQKLELSQTMHRALCERLPEASSVTVEIRDMDAETYQKKS